MSEKESGGIIVQDIEQQSENMEKTDFVVEEMKLEYVDEKKEAVGSASPPDLEEEETRPTTSATVTTTEANNFSLQAAKAPPAGSLDNHSVTMESFTTAASTLSLTEFCKICHCGAEPNMPLITPCFCAGSLKHVHQECLQRWIKSSDIKRCELCKYLFVMQSKVKPFSQWEKLDMSTLERRKLLCSVSFHMVAVTCVVWSLYVLIHRTAEEIREGTLEWPFWTKLVVVAIGFTGGLIFMYIQCKVYVQLCRKWKAYNRIIVVQDATDEFVKNPAQSPPPPPNPPLTPRRYSNHSPPVFAASTSSVGSTDAQVEHETADGAAVAVMESSTSKTNAETQTALRGLNLMEVTTSSSPDKTDMTKMLEDKSIFIADVTSDNETILPGQSPTSSENALLSVNNESQIVINDNNKQCD